MRERAAARGDARFGSVRAPAAVVRAARRTAAHQPREPARRDRGQQDRAGDPDLVLAAIAVHGLVRIARDRSAAEHLGAPAVATPAGHYARFLAITMANPLTIVSFGAAAGALSLDGVAAAGGFVTGVGAASAAWHAALGTAAGHAARWMTPRGRRVLALGGRVAILGLAAHLALTA